MVKVETYMREWGTPKSRCWVCGKKKERQNRIAKRCIYEVSKYIYNILSLKEKIWRKCDKYLNFTKFRLKYQHLLNYSLKFLVF